MNANIVPTVSSLNSLFSLPATALYYYRNTCHRTLEKCYNLFLDFYYFLMDYYNIDSQAVADFEDEEVRKYIQKTFSFKQQLYISTFNDGTFAQLTKVYLKCQKCKEILLNAKKLEVPEQNEERLLSYAQYISPLINKCEMALNDSQNKSTMVHDMLSVGGW
jgi:hypothetical protein